MWPNAHSDNSALLNNTQCETNAYGRQTESSDFTIILTNTCEALADSHANVCEHMLMCVNSHPKYYRLTSFARCLEVIFIHSSMQNNKRVQFSVSQCNIQPLSDRQQVPTKSLHLLSKEGTEDHKINRSSFDRIPQVRYLKLGHLRVWRLRAHLHTLSGIFSTPSSWITWFLKPILPCLSFCPFGLLTFWSAFLIILWILFVGFACAPWHSWTLTCPW